MPKICPILKKSVARGNNVSHAHNKTRRTFAINLQQHTFFSPTLNRSFSMRISTRAIRHVEQKGGLDAYVLSASSSELPVELRRFRLALVARRAA